jgi:hypothetical protein
MGRTALKGTGAGTNTINIFTKGQSGAPFVLTSASNSVAIDLTEANNFELLMTENTTIANPSAGNPGTGGNIQIIQDATTAYTLAYDTDWRSVDGSTPAISTTLGAVNLVSFYYDGTYVWYSLATNGIA